MKYNCKTGIENFLLRLNESNSMFEYISGYVNDNSKVKLRCRKCGNIFERWASSARSGRMFRCFNCERIERESREQKKKIKKQQEKRNKRIDKQLNSIQISFSICKHCGSLFVQNGNRNIFCSKRCLTRNHEQQKTRNRINNAKSNGIVEYEITLDKLINRDKNICHICGKECNLNDYVMVNNAKVTGNYYPSIDHVVPLSKGGTHSWDNVMLAHRICNTLKADKM